jgi:hypothetical protein
VNGIRGFVSMFIVAVLARPAFAQARVVSAPGEPSLLNLTSSWSRASTLGDLREMRTSSDDLELRLWRGFDVAETQAIVVRRTGGHWSAFLARVIRCEIQIPKSVGDTATQATMRRYVAEARRNCGASVTDVSAGARLITTDTLIVQPLDVGEPDIEAAWKDALTAGLLHLPGRVKRDRSIDDGIKYVIEVRRGNEYRAAEIEHLERAEAEADTQAKQIYTVLRRLIR